MADPWDPPADLSGGYFIVEYTNGAGLTHRQRLHVIEFNLATLVYTAPPGSELNVGDTLVAWGNIWKLHYTDAWTLNLISVWHNNGDGTFTNCVPPSFTPVVGTNTNPEAASPAGETIIIARTVGGDKFKIVFISPAEWEPVAKAYITSASSGAPGALMTYLTGSDTAIVAHDNTQPINYASISSPINDRLWRAYHL